MHKKIIQLSLPLILANISLPLCGIVNSALMGNLHASSYLAASALGVSVITFISALFYFLRMSTTGVIAQQYGKRDFNKIFDWLVKALIVAMILAFILIMFQGVIYDLALAILSMNQAVTKLFSEYFNITIYALLFVFINYVLLGFFIALQRAKLAFLMALITSISGVLLSLVFVELLHLDIKGIAYSVVLSQALSCIFALFFSIRIAKDNKVSLKKLIHRSQFNWRAYQAFMSVNGDIFIRSLCLQVCINSFFVFSAHMGQEVLAANTLLIEFSMLLALFLDALANATETLVGENIGQNDKSALKRTLLYTLSYSIAFSLLFVLIYACVYPWVFDLLTSIASVRQAAEHYVIFSIIFPLIAVFSFWLDGVFVGLLKTTIMRNAMIVSMILYLLSVAAFWSVGNSGLWLAYLLFFIYRAITLGVPLIRRLK